jgi:hypothetical protein
MLDDASMPLDEGPKGNTLFKHHQQDFIRAIFAIEADLFPEVT